MVGQVDPKKGYVHCLDDTTFGILLKTLDTLSDFVAYLTKKERFISNGHMLSAAGEEELLAYYLTHLNDNKEYDFAFTLVVFQHIPSYEVIESYVREVNRLLRPGALFKFQVQGYQDIESTPQDTWHGVPYSRQQAEDMAQRTGFELRYTFGEGDQYFWLWYFKRTAPPTWKEKIRRFIRG